MYDSNRFYMWEDQIIFHDGWFIFLDGKGNASVISHKRARERERDFQGYQANMDVGKGGLPYDIAYRRRGFTNENGEFVYRNYQVDKLIKGTIHPITSVLTIPERVGDICINAIDDKAFFCETVIEKVVLHKDILIIGSSAFEGCVNLKELVIPGEHVIISKDAFKDKEPTDQKEATEPYPAKEKEPIDETQTQKLRVKKMEFLFQDGAAFSAGDVRYIHRYYFDPESKSYYMTDINDNNPVRITEEQLNSGKRAKEEFDRAMKEKAGNNQSKETMIIAGARTEKSGKISVKNAHSSEVIPPQIPGRFKGKQLPLKTREEIDFWEQEVANANANRNADMSLWEKISKMKKVESVYVHSIPDYEYPEDRDMDWDTYLYQYRAVHQKLSFINHNSSEEI